MNICKCELISIKLGENPIEDLELLKYLDKENIPYKFDDKEENLLLNFNINTKNFLTKFWEKLISPLESKGKITCFVNLKNNSYYDFKEKDNYIKMTLTEFSKLLIDVTMNELKNNYFDNITFNGKSIQY